MFSLGFSEILIISVIALIFLGPEKLPEAARILGRNIALFRRTMDEVRNEIYATRDSVIEGDRVAGPPLQRAPLAQSRPDQSNVVESNVYLSQGHFHSPTETAQKVEHDEPPQENVETKA
ncbi:MAG: twin-arginine translocase TatA/TatE family subunit [bacterium]|nr:twin-arginine translocase TatA/TatE family subunit [bacterium]